MRMLNKRLDNKMKESDELMHRLIELNYQKNQKANQKNEDFDELDAFMAQNDKQINNDEKAILKDRIEGVKADIERLNQMLTILMPSTFSTAQKAEPKKPLEKKIVDKSIHKHKRKNDGGLTSVFEKLSAMSKVREKEIKKKVEETQEQSLPSSVQQTPRFGQSETGTEPVSMADVEPSNFMKNNKVLAYQEVNGDKDEKPSSFFSEIVKNIKPVGEDDSIDKSKYSSFLKEYNEFHKS